MRDLSDIVLRPSDFQAMASMCRFDRTFPAHYDAWVDMIRLAEQQAGELDLRRETLHLDPSAFEAWCARLEVAPSLDALRAYANVRRRQA